jgi:hypothetical protein
VSRESESGKEGPHFGGADDTGEEGPHCEVHHSRTKGPHFVAADDSRSEGPHLEEADDLGDGGSGTEGPQIAPRSGTEGPHPRVEKAKGAAAGGGPFGRNQRDEITDDTEFWERDKS